MCNIKEATCCSTFCGFPFLSEALHDRIESFRSTRFSRNVCTSSWIINSHGYDLDITWISWHVFSCRNLQWITVWRIGSSQAQAEYFQEQQMHLGRPLRITSMGVSRRYPNSWMVYSGKSQSRNGWWTGVPLFQETTVCVYLSTIVFWCIWVFEVVWKWCI